MATDKQNDAALDADQAAKTAVNAARDAQTLAKAGGNLAAGNAVGAAAEVAKNPGIIVRIIAVIALVLFLVMACLMSLPNMIWSTAEGVGASVSDRWDEADGTTGNHLIDAFMQPLNFFGNAASSFTSWFSSLWNDDKDDGLTVTEDGVLAASEQDALVATTEDMVRRTSKRLLQRYSALVKEIEADSATRAGQYDHYTMTILSPYPELTTMTAGDTVKTPKELEEKYPSFFASVKPDSARLLAAYTVQKSGGIGTKVKWSEYSDWLGAENIKGFGDLWKDYYQVSAWQTRCCYWQGTYMTQPNYERMLHAMDTERGAEQWDDEKKDKWIQEHRETYQEYQTSVLNGVLQHDPAGPSLTVWTEIVGEGEDQHTETFCSAIYTIKRATITDVGKDVMQFQEGRRDTTYDDELFSSDFDPLPIGGNDA